MNVHNDRKYKEYSRKRVDRIMDRHSKEEYYKARLDVKPVKGPRTEFLSYIKDEHMKISDAIEIFLNKYKGYKIENLIQWIREELDKGRFEARELEELKKYIEQYEKNIIDEGR